MKRKTGGSQTYQRGIAVTAMIAALTIFATSVQAQTFTILHYFTSVPDGGTPMDGLIRDSAGNLYGTSYYGGTGTCNNGVAPGCGTIFKLDTTGKETVLYSFTGVADGKYPLAGVVRDAAGNLYGTTSAGGASGYGTVFKLSAADTLTALHSFMGGTDGEYPYAGLVRDAAGNVYGTTSAGGAFGHGTVFKVDTTGKESVLFSFTGGTDGGNPYAGLIQDGAGNLYGTTIYGGTYGHGAVFKLDTKGMQTVLYSFMGGADGSNPWAGLVRDTAGNLYGTTVGGGNPQCYAGLRRRPCGVVFKLDNTGKETVLHAFTGWNTDGAFPRAAVMRDTQGNLHGTTYEGGSGACGLAGCGAIFKIDTTGHETVLYNFPHSGLSGDLPAAALVEDAAGNLYGTASADGENNAGTVFKLTP
jgi:uncharacterized repeat protein (TIGR03803 family)